MGRTKQLSNPEYDAITNHPEADEGPKSIWAHRYAEPVPSQS